MCSMTTSTPVLDEVGRVNIFSWLKNVSLIPHSVSLVTRLRRSSNKEGRTLLIMTTTELR